MKFSFPSPSSKKQEQQQEKVILFVCVENAGRSQMAEGFFNRKYAPKGYRAISAGTRPASHINPVAVQVMKEVGINISGQKSKIITEDMVRSVKSSRAAWRSSNLESLSMIAIVAPQPRGYMTSRTSF